MREVRLQTVSTGVAKNRKPFYTTLFYWLKFSPAQFCKLFYLMPTRHVLRKKDPRLEKDDWVVSCNNRACANIIVWGMSTLEVRGKLADIGLVSVARGNVRWERTTFG